MNMNIKPYNHVKQRLWLFNLHAHIYGDDVGRYYPSVVERVIIALGLHPKQCPIDTRDDKTDDININVSLF